MQRSRAAVLIVAWLAGAGITQKPLLAHEPGDRCAVVCAPSLKVEPTLTIENLFQRHRVEDVTSGEVVRAERETQLEMIVALDVPTTIPRVGLGFEAIWAPFASGTSNPFTGATADELDRSEIRENAVELEFELNLDVLTEEMTGGWLGAHLDIVDQFSPAERPNAGGAYTQKLNFELDVGLAPFNFLEGGWLRGIETETSLDYLATGLPRAGDVVPVGEERYLDDASPWSLSFVLVLPIAAL